MESSYLLKTQSFNSTPLGLIVNDLNSNFSKFFKKSPEIELRNSWTKSVKILKEHIPDGIPVLMEYVFPMGMQRVDLLIIGHKNAHVIEVKGWRNYRETGKNIAFADNREVIQPCYQLEDYISKFRNFHTASQTMKFSGSVFMYNTKDGNDCELIYDPSGYDGKFSEENIGIAREEDIKAITDGKFEFSNTLLNFIKENKNQILKSPEKALVASGYGLSEEQMLILKNIERSIKNSERRVFLIRGKMGSGKTLVALNLALDFVGKDIFGIVAYKNNRLINSIRTSLGLDLKELLQFYSVGQYNGSWGLGEANFDPSKLTRKLDFVVYDEAQRMKDVQMIKFAISRAPITVFFYDEEQILTGDEGGTRQNFIRAIEEEGIEYTEYTLNSVFRMRWGDQVEEFVDSLFSNNPRRFDSEYNLRIYTDIKKMLSFLREREKENAKVALVAAWTKSSGKENDDVRIENPEIRW